MRKETRTIVYDNELQIEAYRFEGIIQSFPNHFHEYYVIGFVENGERYLSCKNQEYTISKGNILLFNPSDNHACSQVDNGTLDYRGFNISKEVMLNLAEEITGKKELPSFYPNVIIDEEISYYLKQLHELVTEGYHEFNKEETLLLLLLLLIQKYSKSFNSCIPAYRDEIERACTFIKQHYAKRIYLDQICQYVNLSKSTLIRAFTKSKGVTPYSYLENIRIGKAKLMLEQGIPAIEVALKTGFSDQSHFTNYFSKYIGLSPRTYQEIYLTKEDISHE